MTETKCPLCADTGALRDPLTDAIEICHCVRDAPTPPDRAEKEELLSKFQALIELETITWCMQLLGPVSCLKTRERNVYRILGQRADALRKAT